MPVAVNEKPTVAVIKGYGDQRVAQMFTGHGWRTTGALAFADMICFTGGSDIEPSLYGEPKMSTTHTMPSRDEGEVRIYNLAKSKGKPIVGICRGGQLINALNGGKMWQDVDRHNGTHAIKDLITNKIFIGTSSHHQMMIPSTSAETIAMARASNYFARPGQVLEIADKEKEWDNPEVVWYPLSRGLCYQGHPEEAKLHEQQYFFSLIERFFRLRASTPDVLAPPYLGPGLEPAYSESGVPFDDDIPFDADKPDPVG